MSFARRLAKRALGRWVWLETYRCLRLQWKQAQAAAGAAPDPAAPLEVRRLERSDLQRYGLEYGISPQFLEGIASRDDLCFGAFMDGKLVSYRFFALQPTEVDSYLRFHFPPRWIYAYKAFTLPAWRGRHLHSQLFLRSLPEVGRWLHGLHEPLGFVTLHVGDNIRSSSALARLGFSRFESFSVLTIRSRPRVVSPSAEDLADFYIEPTGKRPAKRETR